MTPKTFEDIGMFPKIGVPPNHPILIGFSIINHPFWGILIFGNTHIPHHDFPLCKVRDEQWGVQQKMMCIVGEG